jgi:hypothetical protein
MWYNLEKMFWEGHSDREPEGIAKSAGVLQEPLEGLCGRSKTSKGSE